ncbi:MAG: 3-oxoacyl-ACP synthase III [Stenotrophomonas sp.]
MLFENVSIAGLAHVDAPHTLTSLEINERLKPTFERLRIRADMLGDIAGVHARRLWDPGTEASDAALLAARQVLEQTGIRADQLGMLLNTSVSRDYLEPSTASIVSGKLGVGETCITFDIANACLAFVNGMDMAARLIEVGDVQYALVVDAETSNLVYEKTIERLSRADVTAEEVKNELAALTTGSGAAAMLLCHRSLAPEAPRYRGAVTRSANQFSHLCLGNLDRMVTDTRSLLIEGIRLAEKTFKAASEIFGWKVEDLDQYVIHQVSNPHTKAFIKTLGIDPTKVMTIFGEFGNIGPASVPIVLSKLNQLGRLKKGDRIGLMGIGSGLNCSMAEVVW